MSIWKKKIWRSELQKLVKAILQRSDMTLSELVVVLRNTADVKIPPCALAAILSVTEGIMVKNRIFSEVSRKMINVYSIVPRTKTDLL